MTAPLRPEPAAPALAECPPEEAVAALYEGRLATAQAVEVRRHVDVCSACLSALAALAGGSRPTVDPTLPAGGPELWSPPPEFDGFRLLQPLGRGGMGRVYLAHEVSLDRRVAIKVLASARPDSTALARFLIEARAIARLSHPNVVAIYRIGDVEGRPYLAYEYVAGKSLDRLPRPIPWGEALGIALGLSRGLAAAHQREVLHRDIKPANAIVTPSGEVKLLDFGLAKLAHEAQPESRGPAEVLDRLGRAADLTMSGALLGTPVYMAPELWAGRAATARSDIFSLGLLLHELCTGQRPRADLTIAEMAKSALSDDMPAVRALRPDIPEAFAQIIDRCVAHAPASRYADATEVCNALEAADSALRLAPSSRGEPPIETPVTRYTMNGDVLLAYQVIGDGPIDVVTVPTWVTHLEAAWSHPLFARLITMISRFCRVILYDQRGCGLSERSCQPTSNDERLDDLRCVLRAAGADRVVLSSTSSGAGLVLQFAAAHPERTLGMMLFGANVGRSIPEEIENAFAEQIRNNWGSALFFDVVAPSVAGDEAFRQWWAAYMRTASSPGVALAIRRLEILAGANVALEEIRAPALVLHRTGDLIVPIAEARALASRLPAARFVELPGADHLMFTSDTERILVELRALLDGIRGARDA